MAYNPNEKRDRSGRWSIMTGGGSTAAVVSKKKEKLTKKQIKNTKASRKGSIAVNAALGAGVGAVFGGVPGAVIGGAAGAYLGDRAAKQHNAAIKKGASGPHHGNPKHAHAVVRKAVARRHP